MSCWCDEIANHECLHCELDRKRKKLSPMDRAMLESYEAMLQEGPGAVKDRASRAVSQYCIDRDIGPGFIRIEEAKNPVADISERHIFKTPNTNREKALRDLIGRTNIPFRMAEFYLREIKLSKNASDDHLKERVKLLGL